MNIELYSVRGFTGSALKQKLQDMLESYQWPCTISEIHEVDQFIKAGLTSVPAFRIGDKVIQHMHDKEPDETVQQVVNYLLDEHAGFVLAPVDFSEESTHAIDYAVMIAAHLETGVTLVHIHENVNDPVSSAALNVQLLQESQERLTGMADKLNRAHKANGINVPVMTHIGVGSAAGSLIDMLENGLYEMMVMGTKASDTMARRLFGTVSSKVSRHTSKPVIVVPPEAGVKFPGKIVVGLTEELMSDGMLKRILEFGAKENVIFDFVYVTDDEDMFRALRRKLSEALVVYRHLLCGFNIRRLKPEDDPVHESLFDYAEDVHAGMVILVTHPRSFPESLFHSSVTRKALLEPELPLMILSHE